MAMKLAAVAFVSGDCKHCNRIKQAFENILGMNEDTAGKMWPKICKHFPTLSVMPYTKAVRFCAELESLGCRMICRQIPRLPFNRSELEMVFPELHKSEQEGPSKYVH